MARYMHAPEVRFSLEARAVGPAQVEAGKKLFGKLATRACASLTPARSAPNEALEESDGEDLGGEERWP
jgi:hypothetical protein